MTFPLTSLAVASLCLREASTFVPGDVDMADSSSSSSMGDSSTLMESRQGSERAQTGEGRPKWLSETLVTRPFETDLVSDDALLSSAGVLRDVDEPFERN